VSGPPPPAVIAGDKLVAILITHAGPLHAGEMFKSDIERITPGGIRTHTQDPRIGQLEQKSFRLSAGPQEITTPLGGHEHPAYRLRFNGVEPKPKAVWVLWRMSSWADRSAAKASRTGN
jgi:hypothetical protein